MVGARAPGTEQIRNMSNAQKEEKWLFLKDALWGGGGTHRSWPGGRRGRPRALIPGEGAREGFLTRTKRRKMACPVTWTGGLAWRGKAGWVPTGAGLVDGESVRQGLGGVQGLRFRGGRWTELISQRVSWRFLKDAL